MTNYFVRKTGSDAAAGTSAALAWLTIGKALGATGIASGDIVYVGAGIYREAVAVAMTSATVNTRVVADLNGAKTGDAGEVIMTAYTTSDTTTPASSAVIDLAGRDFLSFEGFTFIGGNAVTLSAGAVSTDINVTDCTFLAGFTGGASVISITGTAGTSLNWVIDRCRFLKGGAACILIALPTHSADYNANILIQNTLFIGAGGGSIRMSSTGALAGKGGGVSAKNCTQLSASNFMATADANVAPAAFPCTVVNSFIHSGATTALAANVSGQITENYNVIIAGATPRTNVTAGANSISDGSRAPMISIGQELLNRYPRPLAMPLSGSPLLGFGDDGTAPAVDLLNRPRPAGGAITKAVGALERHDSEAQEPTVVDASISSARFDGPGDGEYEITVNPSATNITIRARYDTNHGTTNKPQATLLANDAIGYAGNTQTMTAAVDTWETLTFPTFTPTTRGILKIRLISRAAAANGKCYFDTLSVS